MNNHEKIFKDIFLERPTFHIGETEINTSFKSEKSFLGEKLKVQLLANAEMCFGINEDTGKFIWNTIHAGSRTLEIGAGISTLIFAMKSKNHSVITPNRTEVIKIKQYAKEKKINLDHVTFYVNSSEDILPKLKLINLDLVFIDGKHSFPWPIIDWFYTVDSLKKGGIFLIDDAQIRAVQIIVDFMKIDDGWERIFAYKNKLYGYRKLFKSSIKDIAWHLQAYNKEKSIKTFFRKIKNI